jgi:uncharacterized protein (TIGR03118 family)
MSRSRLWRSEAPGIVVPLLGTLLLVGVPARESSAGLVQVINLVTDDPSANPAQITDVSLKNPWGMAFSPTSPFWVSDNGTGVATLYSVRPRTNATTKLGLTVTIPDAGSVTGQVFNSGGAGAFNGDLFLFVSEDGTISGWRPALGTLAERLQTPSPTNVYKGTTLVTAGGHSYLLSANFLAGTIDILKGDSNAPDLVGKFTDPNLPANYAPFNIEKIGDTIYVTYALGNGSGEEIAGAGLGIVSKFSPDGVFLGRVASTGGPLNAPWGLAIAPSSFVGIAGNLLVGNFGDGTINIFDINTSAFLGKLRDARGNVLSIDGLWALKTGNDGSAGSSRKLYFTAGPDDEAHGLFGVLEAVPEPSTLALTSIGGLTLLAAVRRRRIGA